MLLLAAILIAASVWVALPAPPIRRIQPLDERNPGASARRGGLGRLLSSGPGRLVVCVVAAGVAGEAANGSAGAAVGVVGGWMLSRWLGRLEPPEVVKARERVARDLPLAIDLMAACAAVGHPSDRMIAVVAGSVGGPLGERLGGLSAQVTLGTDPLAAWRSLMGDQQLAPLARAMSRALESGAPVSQALGRLADDSRRRRRTATQLQARSVGVKAAGPLALCFLPAFMVLGVVPTVVGAFSHLGW